eukprot:432887-Hanusia_phi.AAC.1
MSPAQSREPPGPGDTAAGAPGVTRLRTDQTVVSCRSVAGARRRPAVARYGLGCTVAAPGPSDARRR